MNVLFLWFSLDLQKLLPDERKEFLLEPGAAVLYLLLNCSGNPSDFNPGAHHMTYRVNELRITVDW